MQKQNKFIKGRASFGLSLLLLLINQAGAQAETSSDKIKWLTANLDEAQQSKNSEKHVTLKALAAHQDNSQAKPITVNCENICYKVKLRPFVANRKLPSRHDLELALIEQKAKLAEQANAQLSGQVSTFIVSGENPSNTLSLNTPARNKQISPKRTQYNFALMRQAEKHLLSSVQSNINSTNAHTNAIQTTNLPSAFSSLNTNSSIYNTPIAQPVNTALNYPTAPNVQINSPISEANGPSAFDLPVEQLSRTAPQSTKNTAAFDSAGPPPFPLNLLPEASLKQLIRGLAGNIPHSTNGPKTAFGSWHNTIPLNSASYGQYAKLPYAGFQSHLQSRYKYQKRMSIRHISALPAVTSCPTNSASRKQNSHGKNTPSDTAARNRMLLESQVKVATYPAYTIQSLKLWNFAQ